MRTLGIDTSNYTCSVAIYDDRTNRVLMKKHLLPTPEGAVGLRQSQAVFEQVKLLGKQMQTLCQEDLGTVHAVGVSSRPRAVDGSYMPCFLVGQTVAESISAILHCPISYFSHQQGHIGAALYSAERLEWLSGKGNTFFAFHLSGGTTECLRVKTENGRILETEKVGGSLDLHAGQVVDRVGHRLGLSFPAGPMLEQLALQCPQEISDLFRAVIPKKGCDCCLSGLENICEKQRLDGKSSAEIARFCFWYLSQTIESMLQNVFERYGRHSVLFAGGVSSNRILRDYFTTKYDSVFASPEFSSDNAAGIAVLTCLEAQNQNASI